MGLPSWVKTKIRRGNSQRSIQVGLKPHEGKACNARRIPVEKKKKKK